MSLIDLGTFALFALIASWRFPGLRMLGILLMIGALLTHWTNPMPVADKGQIYLSLDVIGGLAGFVAWIVYRERAGLVFLILAILSCLAHLALFMQAAPDYNTRWMYIATLNVLYVASCIWVGGTGFARLHRHFGFGRRNRAAHFPFRHGGQ